MSEALQKNSAYTEIGAMLAKGRGQLAAALPRQGQASIELHLARADRAIRVAMTQLRASQKLLECTQASIIGSVIQACQLGLELDGVLGQAYLVPYGKVCQMQVGYRGMVSLAIRSGEVTSIAAEVVYARDEFDFELGSSPRLTHRPHLTDSGDPIAVYAIAYLRGGGSAFRVLTMAQVDATQKASKGGGAGPWKDHWEEMARKTAVRALCKYLPQSPDAQRAAVHDEYVASGHAPAQPRIEDLPDVIEGEAQDVQA